MCACRRCLWTMARRRIEASDNSRPRGIMAGCGQSARRSPPSRRHTTSASGAGCEKRSIDAPTAGPEMLKTLRDAAHFFDRRIGWGRLGVALSLVIIIVAVVVLYRILRDIDPDSLLDAIEATDWRTLIIAGAVVALGYVTLTFYDLFALRTIGRTEIPYRIAALSGFTSYAIGHNVGASVFSGGAVRYRIYSAWGLSVVEVTKICFVAGLTFWLGNATLLGLGVLHAP